MYKTNIALSDIHDYVDSGNGLTSFFSLSSLYKVQ